MIQKPNAEEYKQPSKNIHQSNPKNQPILTPFLKLYNFIIGVGAIPVRLLFYRDIGERSISFFGWLLSLGAHIYYTYYYAVGISALMGYGMLRFLYPELLEKKIFPAFDSYSLWTLLLINGVSVYFFRAFLIEGYRILNRRKTEDELKFKSSYYRGDSIFSKPKDYIGTTRWTILGKKTITDDNFRIFIEPQKIFLFGLCLFLLSIIIPIPLLIMADSLISIGIALFIFSYSSVGILVSLSAICLFLEEYGIQKRIRDAALDILDGEKDLERVLEVKSNIEGNADQREILNANYPIVKIY